MFAYYPFAHIAGTPVVCHEHVDRYPKRRTSKLPGTTNRPNCRANAAGRSSREPCNPESQPGGRDATNGAPRLTARNKDATGSEGTREERSRPGHRYESGASLLLTRSYESGAILLLLATRDKTQQHVLFVCCPRGVGRTAGLGSGDKEGHE